MKRRNAIKTLAAISLSALLLCCALAGCSGTDGRPAGTDNPDITAAPGGDNGENGENVEPETEARTMEQLLSVGAVTHLNASDQVYNALELGVPGDGKTDIAEGLLGAVDAVLEKGGGILYLPSGRYKLSSQLVIDNAKEGWICIAGDPDGSSVISVNNKIDAGGEAAVKIDRDCTHVSFVSFDDNTKAGPSVSIGGSGCSFYGVQIKKNVSKCDKTCLEIYGSFNTVRQCSFVHANTGTYQVEFTKYPGRDSYGNVMCDVHFGGSYTKCTLISSHDENGAPEAVTIARNLYLIPSEPMIEVRTVNGLLICNNMLDAASTAVEIAPEGTGVFNVEICDNYVGGSKGGVRMKSGDVRAAGISVHDNYIWAPDSVTAMGRNYSDLSIKYNYCVLTGGQAVYVNDLVRSEIGGMIVANIGGSKPELSILSMDRNSSVDTAGFSSTDVPGEKDRTDPGEIAALPQVPEKTFVPVPAPEVTGDTAAGGLFGKYFNVKDYGAAGDGVTDDTDAVNKCVKAAKAASGTAYFPAGSYLITKTVKVTKDDSKVLTFKGDGADASIIVGAETLDGHIFDIGMKYNFNAKDLGFVQKGRGSCIDALYVKAFDCAFSSVPGNTAPLLHFHGSNCWAVRCRFDTADPESYALCYTRLSGEISINDFITDNIFTGPGKGVLVGNGSTVNDGRCEGLKIHGNKFENTGRTQVEVYEILHVNVAYNTFEGAENAIFLSNLGYGPDGIYIDHNTIKTRADSITSGTVEGGGEYISMVVVHDNSIESSNGAKVSEPVPFNKKMVRE